MTERKLGPTQLNVLKALQRNKEWRAPSWGWCWVSQYQTKVVLDSLVRRGLVIVKDNVYVLAEAAYAHLP